VGRSLSKAVGAQERAVAQLSSGPGNLIGQAEKLKKMGIRTKKEIPSSFRSEEVSPNVTNPEQSKLSFEEVSRDEVPRRSA
jgi:DNA anti-recombination protein RmuC